MLEEEEEAKQRLPLTKLSLGHGEQGKCFPAG
jgi:hypothetical protein